MFIAVVYSYNNMSLNLAKCKVITFTSKKTPILREYTTHNIVISKASRILGFSKLLQMYVIYGYIYSWV